MREKKSPHKQTCSTFCLLLLSSQPRLQHMSAVLREDLGHPSEITQLPQKAPRRGRLSGAQTNLQLLCCSQGHERSGSILCWLRRRLACPARGVEAWPSPPFPKACFLPLLPALTAPVLTLIPADGNPGLCVSLCPVPADHAVLPYFKTRRRVEEAQAVASPVLGYFSTQLREV